MTHDFEQQLQREHPGARVTVVTVDETGPYKVYDTIIRKKMFAYNENYPEDNTCVCGHAYYRHFDPYENWDPVGCKYCQCSHFVHEATAPRMSPFARMQAFGCWEVSLDDYVVQWDLFGHLYYATIEDYLGSSLEQWERIVHPKKFEVHETPARVLFKAPVHDEDDEDDFPEVLE